MTKLILSLSALGFISYLLLGRSGDKPEDLHAKPAPQEEAKTARPESHENIRSPSQVKPGSPPPAKKATSNPTTQPDQLLMSGLERFPVDPEVERYISNLKVSAATKKLLMSGAVISHNIKHADPVMLVPLISEYQKTVQAQQDDFIAGIDAMADNLQGLPPGLTKDMMLVTSALAPSDSASIRNLASSEIRNLKSNSDLNSADARLTLSQSIVSYIRASKDPSAATASIQGQLDTDDPNQQNALQHAQTMLKAMANDQ